MALAVSVARPPASVTRRVVVGLVFVGLGLLMLLVFGLGRPGGIDARFLLSNGDEAVHVPDLVVPARLTSLVLGGLCIVLGVAHAAGNVGRRTSHALLAVVLALFVFSFLCWAAAGKSMSLIGLFGGTLQRTIPLALGALAGVLCERSGVINIAIEGQFLFGAFGGAVVGSALGGLWVGLGAGALSGALLGAILAVFAIRYLVDQVVLGVVLNVFALGVTGFLYDRLLIPYQNTLNSPPTFPNIAVPVLSGIPILGPIFFDANIFLYLTYALVLTVHVALFHTRWGLRVRAVGEHPTAADTVGIKVLATRYRNVLLGGLIAGIGGAYLTIGSVGSFGKNISSGKGFIALAAVIFGRWSPLGAVVAALLFGFADALQNILSILGTPIPSNVLLMAPYLATLFAVAGLVGRVVPPRADGKPYVKS